MGQNEEKTIHDCDVHATGVCAFHNVEVERRRQVIKEAENIPRILTMLNRLTGLVSFITLVTAAGFAYMWHTQKEVSALDIRLVKTELNHEAVIKELGNLNQNMRAFLTYEQRNPPIIYEQRAPAPSPPKP